jgi:DNA-3-methyladenine glycosylase
MRSTLDRGALAAAPFLLGKHLVYGAVTLRITEVEAYCGVRDSAAHTARGRTPRNAPMWGPSGHAYIYLCYGIHQMVNIVCGPVDAGEAVLIRACEVVSGLELVQARRGGKSGPVLLTGPGKVGQALGVTTAQSGVDLLAAEGLSLVDAVSEHTVLTGPRVGIDYAEVADRDAPWRFAIAGTRWVSRRSGLS